MTALSFAPRALLHGVLLLTGATVCTTACAQSIDEFRLSDIEQKIRDLQSTTRDQARLINELQQQLNTRQKSAASSNSTTPISNTADRHWLSIANWQKLKPGMSELQVIELLGTPTQMRISDDGRNRQLLYAMEIGRSGFLSGSVTMSAGQLSGSNVPVLR